MGQYQSISKACEDPSKYATLGDAGSDKDPSKWKTYDFVIIGGGSAGCVVASRLSENPSASVLLLEAGNSHEGNTKSAMPFAFNQTFFTDADWGFYISPQKYFNNREIYYPRGKILGGTSSINTQIYHHCAPEDFDLWAKEGAEGWSYEDLRPWVERSSPGNIILNNNSYFLKSEGYVPNPIRPLGNDEEHGTSGPLKTRKPNINASASIDISRVIIESAKNIGIPTRSDLNTNGSLGVSAFLAAVNDKGCRSSTAVSYLTPEVLKRPNLTVAVNCRVEKILFDESGPKPRAIGAEFRRTRKGPLYRVAARKEVLVCGGVISSPQILLLSGLGPQSELEEKGITVIKHLPAVGKNFADHNSSGTLNIKAKPGITYDYLNNPIHGLLAVAQWFATGGGVMSELATPGAIFVRSDDPCIPTKDSEELPVKMATGPNSPDIEILWVPLTVVDNGMTSTSSRIHGVTFSSLNLQPKSAGQITLATNDPWDPPVIDGDFFHDENDIKVVIRGVRLILKLAHTEPLASILELDPKPEHTFFWPGCADPDKVIDEELIAWVRKNGAPSWHSSCSCRMGASEESSVVNYKLQVHGVDSLRIIDASMFPTLVSGHPCAPVVAVAEKISDVIKEQYGL